MHNKHNSADNSQLMKLLKIVVRQMRNYSRLYMTGLELKGEKFMVAVIDEVFTPAKVVLIDEIFTPAKKVLGPAYHRSKNLIKKTFYNFKKLSEMQQNLLVFLMSVVLLMFVSYLVLFGKVTPVIYLGEPDPNFHYDLGYEMFGPEEPEPTWGERIKFKIFGEPEELPDPYISWDDRGELFYNRGNVHQSHRDYIHNILNPPPPSGLDKLKIEIRLGLKDLFDALGIGIKQTVIDTGNLSKFIVYYTDKTMRYVYDSIPISDSTGDYLALFGVVICSLNYMYTLMRYDPVLYTRVMFLEFRHIPIREIHFFHEYFLCGSAIIVCLLLFTQVK